MRGTPPNKRLKLPGALVLKEAVVSSLAGTGLRPRPLRRRASRPQLKRDPFGGQILLQYRGRP